jgi:diaminopimelate decarboxylase
MDHVKSLISRYFNASQAELRLDGVPVTTIAALYGTPLFIYDSHVLDQKWALLRRTFPPEFHISYSVKANPNCTILQHFLAKGCGLEIASGGEFHQALKAGCPPQRMLFAGPGKTDAELDLVLTHAIGEIHVESLREIERIEAISRRLGVRARVAVRVNPSGEAQGGAMRMGGKPAPFGIDEESLDIVLERIWAAPTLDFRGLHLFTGTQILDATILLGQYRKGLEIAQRVAARLQQPLPTLDFGGGLGIPYFANEDDLDLEALRQGLTTLMAEIQGEVLLAGTQLIVEPGRYLVGEAGVYVTRINDIKISRGKKFLIVDGGMHHHLAASGNLGQVIKRNFPVALLTKLDENPTEVVDVVGPLCTPLDVLARDLSLPRAEVGELIGVFQSGAYARTASPLGFLSHPTPAEVLVENGHARLIRRRGTYDDLFYDIPQVPLT